MHVLLVEDDGPMRQLVGRILEERGHHVDAHADGVSAWAACQLHRFGLAVVDVGLPAMDGLELCRRLRARPGGDSTAVLIVTGAIARHDLAGVLEAGADDYIAKPFRIDELVDRLTVLERLADERERRAQVEEMQARLLDANRRVSASLDLTETLAAIADEALRLTDADVAVVAQPSSGGEYWALLAVRGPLAWHWESAPMGVVGKGAFATALQAAEAVNVPDYAAAEAPPQGPRGHAAGIRSVLAVPLRAGDSVLGVFGAQSQHIGHFTPARQRLLEGLAETAALAVVHAQEVAQRREAQQRLTAVFNQTFAFLGVLRPDGTLLHVNEAPLAGGGYARADAVGKRFWETPWWRGLLDEQTRLRDDIAAAAAGRVVAPRQCEFVRNTGERRLGEIAMTPIRDEVEGVALVLIEGRDVTDATRAAEERDRFREAFARAQERERIAMDLHDVGVQTLFGLSMRLGAASRQLADPAREARAALEMAASAVEAAMDRLRGRVQALQTSTGDLEGPLHATLGALAEEVRRDTGVVVAVQVDAAVDGALPPGAAEHAMYVAREAVTNVARHARVERVQVRLELRLRRILLTVRDDGLGFDAAAVHRGLGLMSMRRRAELLGGRFSIESAPGRGTTVSWEIPSATGAG